MLSEEVNGMQGHVVCLVLAQRLLLAQGMPTSDAS